MGDESKRCYSELKYLGRNIISLASYYRQRNSIQQLSDAAIQCEVNYFCFLSQTVANLDSFDFRVVQGTNVALSQIAEFLLIL